MAETQIPTYYMDPQRLRKLMDSLGNNVKFIGKPRTLEDLASEGTYLPSNATDIKNYLSRDSWNKVVDFLKEQGVDGGLIIGYQTGERPGKDKEKKYCDITIQPFNLEPINHQ